MARNNPHHVKAHAEHEYDLHKATELDKCRLDPIYFIRKYIKIQHPTRGAIDFEMYPFQEDIVNTIHNNLQMITTIGRQSGKTTILAAYVLWYACFMDDMTILIVSNRNSNAMEFIHRVQYAYEELPAWLKPGVDPQLWTKHGLGFDNKTRILSEATTGGSGRGQSISFLVCDELAFVNPRIVDEFWASISPTLATGGKCAIISTPNGDMNKFAELWRGAETEDGTAGDNGFVARFYDWTSVPGRDEAFKKRELAKLGELKWLQEYECQFLSSEELLFDSRHLAWLTDYTKENVPQMNTKNNMVIFEPIIERGATYIVGIDPGKGVGNDYSAIEVWRVNNDSRVIQVAEYRSNDIKTPQLYTMIKKLLRQLDNNSANQVYFGIENNGVGEGLVSLYSNDPDIMSLGSSYMVHDKGQIGMITSGKSKLRGCLMIKDLVEGKRFELKSHALLREMKTYVRHRSSYSAQYGGTDDLLSATLLCARILKDHVSSYDMNAFNAINSYDEQFSEHDLIFMPSIL